MVDEAEDGDGDECIVDPTHATVGCGVAFDGDVDDVEPVEGEEEELEDACEDDVELLVGLLEDVGHGVEGVESPVGERR